MELATNNLNKFALLISFLWVGIGSFLYFDHLVHYPKSFIDHFEMRSLYNCFNYIDDEYRKEDAMEYAKSHGHEYEAQMYIAMGLRFLKPVFKLTGYLSLILFPIFGIWLLVYIRRRKEENK